MSKEQSNLALINSAKENIAAAEKAALRTELLQKRMEKLHSEEEKISSEMKNCKKTISVLLEGVKIVKSNTTSSKKRGRPRLQIEPTVIRHMTLAQAVRKVMTSTKEPMKVKNIAQAVLDIGYKTKIKNPTYFASSVNKILRDDKDMKKVSHGVFHFAPRKAKSKPLGSKKAS
jgi:hypothetical protein